MFIHETNTVKLVMPVLSIIILTLGNWLTDKQMLLYIDSKKFNLIRKSRKSKPRSKLLFVIPKLAIIFYISLSYRSKNLQTNQFNCLQSNTKYFFDVEYLNYCKNVNIHFIREQTSIAALSQIKIQNHGKFFKFLLLLSVDTELNPGPVQLADNSQFPCENYHCFKKRGMHLVHLNINSILPKIDELRLIAQNTNAAVIGLTETKPDETILNEEIEINGYTLERSDRNRKGGGVACYIRNDISFNIRENFPMKLRTYF